MTTRFDKFSEHARRALALAHIEAQRLDHSNIETGHLLLGLVQLPDSQAVRMLSSLNIDLSKLSSAVERIVGRGDQTAAGEIGLADGTKRAIELAVDESRRFDYHHIGTEHLLIALMREGEGAAASALESLGVNLLGLRLAVKQEESAGIAFRTGVDRPMTSRFDKFSEHARQVLSLAQEEAQRFNHNYIGTEHILLGLLRETGSGAVRMLSDLNIEMSKVRSAVEFIIGRGDRAPRGEIGLTPRSKKVIELAVDESRRLDHHYIGTEHLLIGLMREGEGVAAGVLESLGVSLEDVRNHVRQEHSAGEQPLTGADRPMTARFDKFSEHARRVLSLAQEEAQRFNHNYIGTEHILLGLLRETDGVAARVLTGLNIELSKVRSAVEVIIGRGDRAPRGEIGLTPRSKKVIELAVDESRRLDHHYIGTEHLLIGLMREGEGVAAGVLESVGVTLDDRLFDALRQEESAGGDVLTGGPRPTTTATDTRIRAAGRVAGLYVIVDPELTNGRDVVDVARAALRGGATAIQLRDKLHDKGDQLPIARALRELCEEHNASFIVNDHADLAVASNAHGLHVGRHDLPVPEARAILHPHQFIGTSNALLEEAMESIGQQADYIAVGAMYSTSSKDNTRPAGVEALRRVRASVTDIPIVAIGGINLSNVAPLLEAGADGICVIGAVCQADDPEDAARQLVQRITAARAGR